MTTRVAILHYASPPTVGGVESTIAYHARGLADLGCAVRVVSGSGAPFDDRIETRIEPLFGSRHDAVLRVKAALDRGRVPDDFDALTDQAAEMLRACLEGCSALIAHNVHTLHKNLILTAALARLTAEGAPWHTIAWCHDLAWTNTQYQPELFDGYPWDLLRQPWPRTCYVTVSEPRRVELANLLDVPPEKVHVVVPGVDPARFFRWTPAMQRLADRLDLLAADGILLLPARLTRRKNVELALRVLAALRADGRDWRLIVSGPPGPHNPDNRGYLGKLLDLRTELGLAAAAHFVYEHGDGDRRLIPDDDTMANLFQIADALFFPSTQEGFGIPVLEAGLTGLPVFCSDIPPFRHTGGDDVTYFDPHHDAPERIAAQVRDQLAADQRARLRVRVRQSYTWQHLIRTHLVPLMEGTC